MRLVSWKRVKSWKCIACGECCRYFNIPLRGIEYARLSKFFSCEVFDITKKPGKIFLKRSSDGRCVFQYPFLGNWLCGIQNEKPIVCKLFPFLITKSNKK